MLVVAMSPYHLTTREPAALAALTLADHAVTFLPAPSAGRRGVAVSRDAVGRVVESAPAYLAAMESWRWAEELFREGVIGSVFGGEDAADDVRVACARIESDPDFACLRSLMRPHLFEDDEMYLEAVARDLLKAGPDPAVTIPVAAGIDAFAARHSLVVARAASRSVAQRAEEREAERVAAFSVPMLVQASADRLLLARALLREELERLRDELLRSFAGDAAGLRDAAAAYARAFEEERDVLFAPPGPRDPDEVRVVEGEVAVSALRLRADAVLRSSAAAARAYAGIAPETPPPSASRTLDAVVLRVVGRA